MVKYTYFSGSSERTVREYTEEDAFQSIGSRAALGFNVVSMPLDGLVYFTDSFGIVWAIYEFKGI